MKKLDAALNKLMAMQSMQSGVAVPNIGVQEIPEETTISFERKGKFVHITCPDSIILRYLCKESVGMFEKREFDWRTKRNSFVQAQYEWLDKINGGARCGLGVAMMVFRMLEVGAYEFQQNTKVNLDFKLDYINTSHTAMDKWLDIFKGHPKPERGLLQTTAYLESLKYKRGIIALYTGCGKTEILSAIADTHLTQVEDSSVLIMVFNNRVKEEIILRFRDYGIEIPSSYSVDSNINIVNPSAFYRSKLSKDKAVLDKIQMTTMVLADEAHHFTASSWVNMLEQADPEFAYGTTATPATDESISVMPEDFEFGKSVGALQILDCLGPGLVQATLPIPIHLFKVLTKFSKDRSVIKQFQADHPDYITGSLYLHLNEMPCALAMARIYRECFGNEGICYVPVVEIATGRGMVDNLKKLGIDALFMSGGTTYSPMGELDMTLEDIKQLASEKLFQFFITTSAGVEGLDIPNLDSMIPMTGRNYKNIIQSIGRSARGWAVKVAVIEDKFNYMLNRQMQQKYDVISKLQVEKEMRLNFRGDK